MNRFAKVILLFATALLGTGWIILSREEAAGPAAAAAGVAAPLAGHLAPDFTAELLNGETVSLSDYRGTPVVLNFWATWCPPCRAEIPHFEEAAGKYEGQVVILGLNSGELEEVVAPFVEEFGMTYPVLLDPANSAATTYQVRALPTTVFIRADGVIEELFPGIVNAGILEARIQQLMGR